MERAAPDLARSPVGRGSFHAPQHLCCGPPSEGEEQDPIRVDAVVDQTYDAADEGLGLAGAGAGDDQQRRAVVVDSGSLLGVQVIEHTFSG